MKNWKQFNENNNSKSAEIFKIVRDWFYKARDDEDYIYGDDADAMSWLNDEIEEYDGGYLIHADLRGEDELHTAFEILNDKLLPFNLYAIINNDGNIFIK